MAMAWDANLDPKAAELVNAAFDKSWQFVKTDPELAHGDPQEMRARLGQNLARLAQNGERDLWRLANAAIGQLRRERSAAEGASVSRGRTLDIGHSLRRRHRPDTRLLAQRSRRARAHRAPQPLGALQQRPEQRPQ